MHQRLALVVLVLTLLAVPVHAASPPDPDAKGAAPADPAEPSIPATTELGMVIMALLVMTASTGALFGGGILRGGLRERPAAASTARERDEAKRAEVAPKRLPTHRSRRASDRDHEQRQLARKGWNATRRSTTRTRPRRRGGPGCRGVR